MGRRILLNVGLVVAVAVLALLVWFEPGRDEPAAPSPLTSLSAIDVTDLAIRREGSEEIRLRRHEGEWFIDAPVRAEANEFRIEPLLRVVEAESHARFHASGDLRQYGLDPPRAIIIADGVEIAFGGTEPLDHRRYVRVGDAVHLIDDFYYFRLQADYPGFVSNRVLPRGSAPAYIEQPGSVLTRDAEGGWSVEPPSALSPDEINDRVDAWETAQALEVEPYGGDEVSRGAVVIVTDKGERIALDLLARGPGVSLGRSDLALAWLLSDDVATRLGLLAGADE